MKITDEDISIVDLCKESGKPRPEVVATMKRLGIKPFKMKGKLHIENTECNLVLKELDLPEQFKPKRTKATFLYAARSPKWIYATVDGYPGKHEILIPQQLKPKIRGKRFWVDVIEDKKGITFRHEWFGKFNSLKR